MRRVDLLPCLLAAALAACSNPSSSGTATPPGELPDQAVPSPDAPATAPATVLDAARLGGYHWQLVDAIDGRGTTLAALTVPGAPPLQLAFADGRIAVTTACNRLAGSYTLEGPTLRLDRLVSTRMACVGADRMEQERLAGQLLSGSFAASLTDRDGNAHLQLTAQDGTRLEFRGEPTADSRFGGPGDTVFLEVAAQPAPCAHPLMRDAQCLQVRELRFDDAGLRQGEPGPWRPLYETIDGYTHEDGVRNVLRLKRYTRSEVPADASRYAYVLDMVVETERMPR